MRNARVSWRPLQSVLAQDVPRPVEAVPPPASTEQASVQQHEVVAQLPCLLELAERRFVCRLGHTPAMSDLRRLRTPTVDRRVKTAIARLEARAEAPRKGAPARRYQGSEPLAVANEPDRVKPSINSVVGAYELGRYTPILSAVCVGYEPDGLVASVG